MKNACQLANAPQRQTYQHRELDLGRWHCSVLGLASVPTSAIDTHIGCGVLAARIRSKARYLPGEAQSGDEEEVVEAL